MSILLERIDFIRGKLQTVLQDKRKPDKGNPDKPDSGANKTTAT